MLKGKLNGTHDNVNSLLCQENSGMQKSGGCKINCVNGHRIVKLLDMKGILWLTGHRNS